MKALRIEEYGSVEVLEWKDTPEPTPSPHQVLIQVDAAGVNYADLMRRQGNYPGPDLPATLGSGSGGHHHCAGFGRYRRAVGCGPDG